MDKTNTDKLKKLAVLLSVCQDLMDELSDEGMIFRHKLKFTQKNFSAELDSFIKDLYGNMSEEAELELHNLVNTYKTILGFHEQKPWPVRYEPKDCIDLAVAAKLRPPSDEFRKMIEGEMPSLQCEHLSERGERCPNQGINKHDETYLCTSCLNVLLSNSPSHSYTDKQGSYIHGGQFRFLNDRSE